MTSFFSQLTIVLAGMLLLPACSWGAAGESPPSSILAPLDYASVRAKTIAWGNRQKILEAERQRILAEFWPESPFAAGADAYWERAIQTFSALQPEAKKFLSALQSRSLPLTTAQGEILFQHEQEPFFTANLRLHYARWLTQRGDCETAMSLLQQINPAEVISPAAYLFYKATCEKQLLKREEGLKTLTALLSMSSTVVPQRYLQSARLMKVELERLKPNSLEEISWMMNDVERRLKLTQTGKKTQLLEEQIVKNLDKLIKQMEDQQNNSSQSPGAGGGSAKPNQTPATESRLKGGVAPGDVDSRKLTPGDSWGNLNEKERTKVKNLISRDFPAHYRQAIEEYFRKLATREENHP